MTSKCRIFFLYFVSFVSFFGLVIASWVCNYTQCYKSPFFVQKFKSIYILSAKLTIFSGAKRSQIFEFSRVNCQNDFFNCEFFRQNLDFWHEKCNLGSKTLKFYWYFGISYIKQIHEKFEFSCQKSRF